MTLSRRVLKAMIAGNPQNYAGLGEWRYCHDCGAPFFARASQPDPGHGAHRWIVLPSLDPEGQTRLVDLFRRFIRTAFSPARQAELEAFAERQGWDMACEQRAGGGALSSEEAARWHQAAEDELERLVDEAERWIKEDRCG